MPKFLRRFFPLLLTCAFLSASPVLRGEDAAAPQPTENGFQRWWDGSSALPVVHVRMHETFNRKIRSAEGSAIPETSLRHELADRGISFQGSYTAFFMGNVSGGQTQDFAYNHMLFFQLNLDLEKIANWKGGTIVWSWADNAGSNLSNSIGNDFQISTDYGPNTFMFNEFYFMQTLLDGKLHIKLGQMSLLNDFLASPLYDSYSNLAFCGNPLAVAFNVSATAMPTASWGAYVKYTEPDWYAQVGVYQVSDRIGKPAYHGFDYSIRAGDGTMIFAETGWTPTFFKESAPPPASKDGKSVASGKSSESFSPVEDLSKTGYKGHYKFGAFFSNFSFAPFSNGPAVPNMYGFYFLADQMVFQESDDADQGLYLWSAFTVAPQQLIAQIPFFVSGGAQYVGLIPNRDRDYTIFGVAYGRYSRDLASQQTSLDQPQKTYEMVFEWSYEIKVNSWLTVQPDVQYIVNPGATHTIQNAWVLGAILNANF